MGRRKTWFAISGAVVLISIASLAVRGLNFGIDFKGGTQVTFTTPQPVSLAKVRSDASTFTKQPPVVQGRGRLFGSDAYRNFQLRMTSLSASDTSKLSNDIRAKFAEGKPISFSIQTVSSSFGRQIARAAIMAVLFSLLLIFLYIAIRFDFKFALPVMIALLHDILITVGVYSLTGREVSNATVAAVLTVLGYSIYDTIIIFDRIRENVPLMRRAPFASIANISLWETIRRSLATTLITLLPIISLYVFGGATLKDFAFALIIGIVSGAYSSIFIAAPLVTTWKEREPDWARRKAQAAEQGFDEGLEPDDGTPAPLGPQLPGAGPAMVEPGAVALETGDGGSAQEQAPPPGEALPQPAGSAQGKRDRRRKRRSSRPHGRAR